MQKSPKPDCGDAGKISPARPKPGIRGKNGGQEKNETLRVPGSSQVMIFGKEGGKVYMREATVTSPSIHIDLGSSTVGLKEGGHAVLGKGIRFNFCGISQEGRAILEITEQATGNARILLLDSGKAIEVLLPGLGKARVSLVPESLEVESEAFHEPEPSSFK